MRVLVTWGSEHGGTEGIGHTLAEALEARGHEVTAVKAREAPPVGAFDAVIVGGALYANRWHGDARRFVQRNVKALGRIPVWLFSSGPLDDSATHTDIAATGQVTVLAERIGAQGHVTFGGFLAKDEQGFPASAMAKEHAGDWRDPAHIRAWATEIADALPDAKPRGAIEPAARSIPRLVGYATLGWAVAAVVMLGLLQLASPATALVLCAIATPLIFAPVAWCYFRAHGARDPMPTAIVFTAVAAILDLVVIAGALERSLAIFGSVALWLSFGLIFLTTWAVGGVMSTMPWPSPSESKRRPAHP